MSVKLYQRSRILRNFRHSTATKFHAINQRVSKALSENKIPASVWASNPELVPTFLSASAKYDAVYHRAKLGSKLDIAERDVLQAQSIEYLDEIASMLEAAAIRSPEVLLLSGFDLAKERRISPRVTVAHTVSEDSDSSNEQPPTGS